MTYSGKHFEQDFVHSYKDQQPEFSLLRLYDTTNGYSDINNPCDFIGATEYGTAYIELKTVKGASLPFSNITDAQWDKMGVADTYNYTFCGILCYFSEKEILMWYPIRQLIGLKGAGVKSINPERLPQIGFPVEFEKRRTRIRVKMEGLLYSFHQDRADRYGEA